MRTYLIEYNMQGELKAEAICARTSTVAVKMLCDKLRQRGRPVTLEIVSIQVMRFA